MVKAKKSYSQNFLVDPRVPAAIVAAVPLSADKPNVVLEVGAGRGALTQPLLDRLTQPADRLVAVEVDAGLMTFLQKNLGSRDKCQLLGQNILGVWPEAITPDGEQRIHVVGNLPYHMTGQILFHFCGEMAEVAPRWRHRVASFTLMVQQEVADRLMAQPGNSAVNPLTWSVQTWFKVEPVLKVPPAAFRPQPRVNSAVIQLIPLEQPLFEFPLVPMAAKLLQASFRQPRKTLRNNWMASFGAPDAGHAIWRIVPDAMQQTRPHTVPLAEWQTWTAQLAAASAVL